MPVERSLRLTPAPGSLVTLRGFDASGVEVHPARPLAGAEVFTLQGRQVACKGAEGSRSASRWVVQGPVGLQIGSKTRWLPGRSSLLPSPGGLRLVSEMAEEEYVAAVLREEGTSSMPREALKALAVCVRTYAERCRGRHASEGFDLCGTTHCQCFGGVDAAAGWAQVAARETRGQVLQQQGRPIFAVYSTDCGGSTANNEDVGLGSSPWPYLRSTRDAPTDGGAEYCGAGRYHRWELVVTREELERRLNTRAESRVGRLTALALEAPDTWGRPTRFRATGEATPKAIPQCAGTLPEHKGTGAASEVVRVLPMARLRQLLGEARLKSTFAEVSVLPSGSLRFRGRGYGHGAGLCMTGAVGMASAPFLHRYNEILEHYYQGAELVSLVPAAPSPPEWQGAVEQ